MGMFQITAVIKKRFAPIKDAPTISHPLGARTLKHHRSVHEKVLINYLLTMKFYSTVVVSSGIDEGFYGITSLYKFTR